MKIALVVTPIAALAVAVAALRAVPSGAQSQADKTWSLEQGRGISAAEPASRPSLKVDGQRLSGSTGCNSFTATIAETGERIKIENLSLTRKLCATLQNENERAFVNALGQTQYLAKEPEKITFLSDKREPLLVWTSTEPKARGNEGGRDRSLMPPRITQNDKPPAPAEAHSSARPKETATRHPHPRHKHVGRGHAHPHRHAHGHGYYVRLRWGCHDLY